MEPVRDVPLAVVALVVLVVALTGPFGPLSVPTAYGGDRAPGTGNATVAVTAEPGEPRLEPGRQGEGIYYLRVPDVEVAVSDLRGNPTLSYRIEIESLGYTRGSAHFLGAAGPGRHAISLESDTFDESRLDRDAYNATIELVLRTEGTAREVYRAETTVVVE